MAAFLASCNVDKVDDLWLAVNSTTALMSQEQE